jgi:hypothetical protein
MKPLMESRRQRQVHEYHSFKVDVFFYYWHWHYSHSHTTGYLDGSVLLEMSATIK